MSIRGSVRCALLMGALIACSPADATIHHPGKWTQDSLAFNGTAVNMMLVPYDSVGQHSRILWWADEHGDVPDVDGLTHAGRFAWRPANDTSASLGYMPYQNFVSQPMDGPNFNYFCSAMGYLADGNMLVAGGTTEAENGENHAAIYYPQSNLWRTLPDTMHTGRWYPSLTTLPNGKVLVSSGSRFRHMWVFGGGASNDSTMYRVPVSHVAGWESALKPDPDESHVASVPIPRRGHTATWSLGSRQAYFGGVKLSDATQYLNDTWLLTREVLRSGSDYRYFWQKRSDRGILPAPRAFHAAVVIHDTLATKRSDAETYVVLGGQLDALTTANDVWCGLLVPDTWTIRWSKAFPVEGDTVPAARYGHVAYYQEAQKQVYVFGGCGSSGVPADQSVWTMEFSDSTTVQWHLCEVENPSEAPAPRRGMAVSVINRKYIANTEAKGLMMFGGRTSANVVSDSLFVLWITGRNRVRWQRVEQTAAGKPPALEWASGTANDNAQEFWLIGGKDASGTPSVNTYSFYSRCDTCTSSLKATWEARAAAPAAIWGHTAPQHEVELFSPTPEVFNPADSTFTELTSMRWMQDWYPQMFVLPNGKVFGAGPDRHGNLLDFSGAGARDTFPARWLSNSSTSFRGGSAVMYRPGKVMKCGSRDTDNRYASASGQSATIDLTASSPQWTASESMLPRVNFNLLMLPDGKALAVGGSSWLDNDGNSTPVFKPEIWNPDSNSGVGTWEGADGAGTQLAASRFYRGYHSSALLLPDARVLVASGNSTTNYPSQYYAPFYKHQLCGDLYSPPYLFNADGSRAMRDSIVGSPRRVSYGQRFVVRVTVGSNTNARFVLIRPGAVTHGFDESQRYVELSSGAGSSYEPLHAKEYWVDAPADSAVAPPGEYLLFALNAQGTPSIAQWVRINSTNGSSSHPRQVANLAKDCSSGTSVTLRWTPPADDSLSAVPGVPVQYEVRYHKGNSTYLTSWSQFQAATLASESPTPAGWYPAGQTPNLWITIDNLTPDTTYSFRLISKNASSGSGNWSAMSNVLSFITHDESCGGSGGGGGGGGYMDDLSVRRGDQYWALRRPGVGVTDSNYVENTLLPLVRSGVTSVDRVRLPFGPRWTNAGAKLRLSESGTGATHFGAVRLLAVDHAAGEQAFTRAGEIVVGTTGDSARVTHADGRDLSAELAAGAGFEGHEGDTVYVEFASGGAGDLALSASKAQLVRYPDSTGLQIDAEMESGWVRVGRMEPRERLADEVFVTPNLGRLRVVFLGEHRLEGVARFTPGAAAQVTSYSPSAVTHGRLGDVSAAFASGEGATLLGGDHMYAGFGGALPVEGGTREWFMEVEGVHVGASGTGNTALTGQGPATLPTRFALGAPRPNPFRGSSAVTFDLPSRANVRLEVFDVLGRKVATLAHREYPAGRHSLEWNGRTSNGDRAAAGVYLCRMIAGEFRAQARLVRVP